MDETVMSAAAGGLGSGEPVSAAGAAEMLRSGSRRPGVTVAEVRALVAQAREALLVLTTSVPPEPVAGVVSSVSGVLWQADSDALVELLGELGELGLAVEAAEVVTVAEAIERGEPGACVPPLKPVEWVKACSRRYQLLGAARLVKVAELLRPASTARHEGRAYFADAVRGARLSVPGAAAAAEQIRRVEPLVNDEIVATLWSTFCDVATIEAPGKVSEFREKWVAYYGGQEPLERAGDKARAERHLSRPRHTSDDLHEYTMRLDAESMAILEAALGPGSAPRPDPETGARDPRPQGRRRAEALLDLVRAGLDGTQPGHHDGSRAQIIITIPIGDVMDHTNAWAYPTPTPSTNTAAGTGAGTGTASGPWVGIDLSTAPAASRWANPEQSDTGPPDTAQPDLAQPPGAGPPGAGSPAPAGPPPDLGGAPDESHTSTSRPPGPATSPPPPPAPDPTVWTRHGAGTVIGSTADGTVLPLSTVSKLACDAVITPMITFPNGSPLHMGATKRYYTPAQHRAMVMRDRGCTFPGCTAPGNWCDSHHLLWWVHRDTTQPATLTTGTDINHGCLLCDRHHTLIHRQRLHGWVELTPDGPHVQWDLTPGSYDTHLATLTNHGAA